MAAFPTYAGLAFAGASLEASPVVQRSEVERGIPRTRRVASDALVTLQATILLNKTADVLAFEEWYYSPAGANGGAAWFDWKDPRNGTVRSVRMASLGALQPRAGRFRLAQWPCTLEYVRSTYP